MLAKVKNHAIVQRGLLLSVGRSDYIHAGTQVLLNTLSLSLVPKLVPYPTSPPPPTHSPSFLSSPLLPAGPVQVQMAICCTTPTTCFLPLLVPNSVLNTKQKEKKERIRGAFLSSTCSLSRQQQHLQSRWRCKAALLYDQPVCSLLSIPPLEVITHKDESKTGERAVYGCS